MHLLKLASPWLLTSRKQALKLRNYAYNFLHKSSIKLVSSNTTTTTLNNSSLTAKKQGVVVCEFEGCLLTSQSLFLYFMLVAFEGGNLLRALLLLIISVPFLCVLGQNSEVALKVMMFVTFCGLRTKDMDLVSRVVLPKFYMENLHSQAFDVLASDQSNELNCDRRVVVVSSLPRVMVLGFLRDYLSVDELVAVELEVINGGYFTGFMSCIHGSSSISTVKKKALKEMLGGTKVDVAFLSPYSDTYEHVSLITCSKEVIILNKEEHNTTSINNNISSISTNKYPKPLIFHDSRLAFIPTPSSMLALFTCLPMATLLSITRIIIGFLPYKPALVAAAATGIRIRLIDNDNNRTNNKSSNVTKKGILYVCNHRTLLDPVILNFTLQTSLTAVTYSLSRTSEIISPIKTVRLARNRDKDAATIQQLLSHENLVICPEGTTCREPYLLRFSSLFAELSDDIVPVAMDVSVNMFYGTTVSGKKWLDSVFLLMNPMLEYRVEVLSKVPSEMSCRGGRSATEVANWVQRQIGEALGFQCTCLTRRDKYMMLVGSDGRVNN